MGMGVGEPVARRSQLLITTDVGVIKHFCHFQHLLKKFSLTGQNSDLHNFDLQCWFLTLKYSDLWYVVIHLWSYWAPQVLEEGLLALMMLSCGFSLAKLLLCLPSGLFTICRLPIVSDRLKFSLHYNDIHASSSSRGFISVLALHFKTHIIKFVLTS